MKRRIIYSSLVLLCLFYKVSMGQINHLEEFSLPLEIKNELLADSTNYIQIFLPETVSADSLGFPTLPVKFIKLIVPINAKELDVKINNVKKQKYFLEKKIAPQQKERTTGVDEKPDFIKPNENIYNSDLPYPLKQVEIVKTGYLRGNHLVTLAIYPCQYYPKKDELDFYNFIEFTLDYKLDKLDKKKVVIKKHISENRKVLEYLVANKNDIDKFSSIVDSSDFSDLMNWETEAMLKSTVSIGSASDLDYVIVTNEDLESSFDDFMDWKRRKGVKIGLVTLEDIYEEYTHDEISGIYDNAGKVRQFLKDAYDNGNGIEYALLGGDHTVVPIRYSHYEEGTTEDELIIPTDLYFADFDGDWAVDPDGRYGEPSDDVDYEMEIYVGRVMVSSTSEVGNWTQKVLKYEQNPGNGSYSYLTKAFYTHADFMQRYNHARIIANAVTWCSDTTIFEEDGGPYSTTTPSFPTGNDVISEFNNHYGFASFMAHGRPNNIAVATRGDNLDEPYAKRKVTSKDDSPNVNYVIPENGNGFDNMTNGNYPTVYYSVSCETMPFDDFHTPTTDRNMGETYTCLVSGGGPVYLGNTRNGYSISSKNLFLKFADVISSNTSFHIGNVEATSKENNGIGYCPEYLKFSHNLLGCPETEIWTDTPSTFSNVSVSYGSNYMYVSVGYISDVTVCVMSIADDGDSYYEVSTFSNTELFQNMPVDPEDCCITITKHNYIPYLANVASLKSLNITDEAEFKMTMEKGALLGQNQPNPFYDNTRIDVFIPSKVTNAELQVYDVQGEQIQSLNIDARNQTSITLDGSLLSPGIYYYSLINDGVKVATKKMVLTE